MSNFRKEYRDLETRVYATLRDIVIKSNYRSKFTGDKAIKILVIDYVELSIVNDKLVFFDRNGSHYSGYDVDLEELIIIIEQNEEIS
jgi:hypothetical protein